VALVGRGIVGRPVTPCPGGGALLCQGCLSRRVVVATLDRVELEQPKPEQITFVRVRAEHIRTSCDTKHWPQLLQDPGSELDYERHLREHSIIVDDVE
jgi:hypothetical protein